MLGHRIRELRDSAGYSQEQLADLLSEKMGKKISKAAVGTYERGTSDVSSMLLAALADIFQVSIETVLGRADHVAEAAAEYSDADDWDEVVTAILRARRLPSDQRSRLAGVIKAGWPDLFAAE